MALRQLDELTSARIVSGAFADLPKVLAKTARVLRSGHLFLCEAINRYPVSRFATITIAEDFLRPLHKGPRVTALVIKPSELRRGLSGAGLVPGPTFSLAPRGTNRRGDIVFGPLSLRTVIYFGMARKPGDPA